jgi:hypothetical protein
MECSYDRNVKRRRFFESLHTFAVSGLGLGPFDSLVPDLDSADDGHAGDQFMCGWPPPGKRKCSVQHRGRLQSCVRRSRPRPTPDDLRCLGYAEGHNWTTISGMPRVSHPRSFEAQS